MKELSNYFSENMQRQATVFHIKEEKVFKVVAKTESGSHYSTCFSTEDAAEQFAEEWVLKDE